MSLVLACAAPDGAASESSSLAIGIKLFEHAQRQVGARLEQADLPALASQIRSLVPQRNPWRPEVRVALEAQRTDASLAALQLALFSCPQVQIAAAVAAPGKLLVDGHAVDVSGHVSLAATDDQLSIRSQAGITRFRADRGQWICAGERRLVEVISLGGGEHDARYVLDARQHRTPATFPDPMRLAREQLSPDAGAGDSVQRIRLAIESLRLQAPDYLKWVGSVVRGMVLTDRLDAGLSSPRFPGLIAVQAGLDTAEYAELIVCGAAQQRLHQLALVCPLTMDGTEEVHYLPARRTYTTTRRALAAAHEHANAIAVLDSIALAPDATPAVGRRRLLRRLMLSTDCWPLLERSQTLSSAGRELWSRAKAISAGSTSAQTMAPHPSLS